MIVQDNFFPEPKEYPLKITVPEICERFSAAGLACRAVRHKDEVQIIFTGRTSKLAFTVNASGHLLTAVMSDETDHDVEFASVVFDVFDSIGWTYAPS